jgi:hypothetical protein
MGQFLSPSAQNVNPLWHRVIEDESKNQHVDLLRLLDHHRHASAPQVARRAKGAKAIIAETLRYLYVATKGKLPRRKSEAAG